MDTSEEDGGPKREIQGLEEGQERVFFINQP